MAKYLHSELYHLVADVWYIVRTELSGEKLTVKYKHFTEEEKDIVFKASSFSSLEDLHAFRARFRSLSPQLKNNECDRGVSVCASHSFNVQDVRFYGSVVDDCNGVIDPKVDAFISLVKGRLAASSTAPKLLSLPMKPKSTFAQRMAQGTKYAKRSSPHATCPVKEVERGSCGTEGKDSLLEGDSSHCAGMMEEGDFGGGIKLFGLLIDNLDKHLLPPAIMEFIYAKTSLSVQAYVFPSLPYETYTRGAIVVNCENNLEKLCKFLGSPDHVVVSCDGRPWVVTGKLSQFNTFIGPIHALILKNQNKLHLKSSVVNSNDDLKLICSGSAEYTTAKELRVLFEEFVEHRRGLHIRLAVEERGLQPSERTLVASE